MSSGFMVVYNYKGYELPAGNRTVYPVRELAEKFARNYASRPWCNHPLYIVEQEYVGEPLELCRIYKGKTVYNKSYDFGIDCMEIGDYVEDEVVDNYMNCLPPVCYTKECSQVGEPCIARFDEEKEKYRNTYETFKYVSDGVWEYCGDCFMGETVKRGKTYAEMAEVEENK